jgi:general secretion pathway protein G
MTLVEIMIVVIIMALIATAVGLAVLPALGDSRIRQTRSDAATMQAAVIAYLATGADGCPSSSDLAAAGILNASTRARDAWDHDFVIECEGDRVFVSSAGPDGQLGTEDDVR